MTKKLLHKIKRLDIALADEKERKYLAKHLQQEIAGLIEQEPDLPHKGDHVWLWCGYYATGMVLNDGPVEEVVWRPKLQCFKVKIRFANGWYAWRTLDKIWYTEASAKRWKLSGDIERAKQKLTELEKQLDELLEVE